MSLFELSIIYFTLGAPFGVYALTLRSGATCKDIVHALGVFVFWPIFALRVAIESASLNLANSRSNDSKGFDQTSAKLIEDELMTLRSRLRGSASSEHALLFESVDQFASLSLALLSTKGQSSLRHIDLLTSAGHANPKLGAKALERRNRRNLIASHLRARFELDGMIAAQYEKRIPEVDSVLESIELLLREAPRSDLEPSVGLRIDEPAIARFN